MSQNTLLILLILILAYPNKVSIHKFICSISNCKNFSSSHDTLRLDRFHPLKSPMSLIINVCVARHKNTRKVI
jgi:hypothetical protein